MNCQLCKKEINNYKSLAAHVRHQHKEYSKQTYYDAFLKKKNDGICKTCGNQTTFRGLCGYSRFCSFSCRSSDEDYRKKQATPKFDKKQSKETIRKRIVNTDQSLKETNRIKSLQERYGENVTNPSQTPGWKDRYIASSLRNWGTEHPTQNPAVFKDRNQYKKRKFVIEELEFVIQGYEDVFLTNLHNLFPNVTYKDLIEERTKTLYRKNGSVHYPDFYSKKHNHMFEIKSMWTFNINKEDVLLKKKEAEEQGYQYSIIIWKRRNSKPRILVDCDQVQICS